MELRRLKQYMGEEFYILAEAESSETPAEFQRCPIGNTGVVAKNSQVSVVHEFLN